MKTIQFELGNGAALVLPDDAAAQHLVERQRNKPQPAAASRPGIGEYFLDQGGIYIGDILGDDRKVYSLIMAEPKEAVIRGYFGGWDVQHLSQWDGLSNTERLRGKSPAAKLATDYEADGHHDFYLPSRREMMIAVANVPMLFMELTHWTSTPFNPLRGYAVGFPYGDVLNLPRENPYCVRPFRRLAL